MLAKIRTRNAEEFRQVQDIFREKGIDWHVSPAHGYEEYRPYIVGIATYQDSLESKIYMLYTCSEYEFERLNKIEYFTFNGVDLLPVVDKMYFCTDKPKSNIKIRF